MSVDMINSSVLRTPPETTRPSVAAETATRPRAQEPEPEPQAPVQGATEPRGVPRRIGVEQQLPPNTRLRVDKESNQIVAQILDENNEVVRQIPPEALLELSSKFNKLEGLLFDREI